MSSLINTGQLDYPNHFCIQSFMTSHITQTLKTPLHAYEKMRVKKVNNVLL